MLYAEILDVNGIPLPSYIEEKIFPYVWHGNMSFRFKHGLLGYVIGCCEKGNITIAISQGNMTIAAGEKTDIAEHHWKLETKDTKDAVSVYASGQIKMYITRDNICLFRILHFRGSSLKDELYNQIDLYKNCAGYVIDVCDNEGGSSYNGAAVASLFF